MAAAVQFSGASLTRGFVSISVVLPTELFRCFLHSSLIFFLLALSGCSSSNLEAVNDLASEVVGSDDSRNNELVEVLGDIISGDQIEGIFQFTNLFGEPISIANARDIRIGCNCTKFDLTDQSLLQGDIITVKLGVNTQGKVGQVAQTVSVLWTADSGKQYLSKFTVRAFAHAAIIFDPPAVHFTPENVSASEAIQVKLSSHFPIDWTSASLFSLSPHVIVVDWESVNKSPNEGHFLVTPNLPKTLASHHSEIAFQARSCSMNGSNITRNLSGTLYITSKQSVPYALSPPIVRAKFSRASDSATCTVLLQGTRVHESCIVDIVCDELEVSWKVSSARDGSVVLNLTLQKHSALSEETHVKESELRFDFMGGSRLWVPCQML